MSWNAERSKKRIRQHLETVPEFEPNLTLAEQRRMRVEARTRGLMDQLSRRYAFVVSGAHVYGQLLDFELVAADVEGLETEASHENLLRFLDAQYRLWDSIVEGDEGDRVDYHGARMHAIMTTPAGDPWDEVQRALALAAKLDQATKRVAAAYGVPARLRFGIDHGRCVAMTTGRAIEKDTLFLGSPANHAAKVAAGGDEEGIFLASGAQAIAGEDTGHMSGNIRSEIVDEALVRHPFYHVDQAAERLIADARRDRQFLFHRATPPLSSVKFADLVPSRSVRMNMASIFADIDGFTAFVDQAVLRGSDAVRRAAAIIHVVREELNSVLKDDFGGKRVRFIGDCIQGVLAERPEHDDAVATVEEAALCASAMKSSFSLCESLLEGMDELDLAIGIEYGPIPLTRIGHRGKESIRCAAGRAVVVAERIQQSIDGGGIKLGPEAINFAGPAVRRYFGSTARIPGYDSAADLLSATVSPSVRTVQRLRTARSHVG